MKSVICQPIFLHNKPPAVYPGFKSVYLRGGPYDGKYKPVKNDSDFCKFYTYNVHGTILYLHHYKLDGIDDDHQEYWKYLGTHEYLMNPAYTEELKRLAHDD